VSAASAERLENALQCSSIISFETREQRKRVERPPPERIATIEEPSAARATSALVARPRHAAAADPRAQCGDERADLQRRELGDRQRHS